MKTPMITLFFGTKSPFLRPKKRVFAPEIAPFAEAQKKNAFHRKRPPHKSRLTSLGCTG
jgi:hypothetical protein